MNRRAAGKLIIGCIALHSLLLGAGMLANPRWMLRLAGWEYEGSVFFPSQSGLFLLILGGAYLAALWNRSFAWLLIGSKAGAVAFLVGTVLLKAAPPVVLIVAALDGLMGAAVAWVQLAGVERCDPCAAASLP